MQALAIVVGAAIAVAGWIASGILARRAVRRQMRVEYLLSAYRRLEAASNRSMTLDHEGAIESAVSDVQLLGSKRQVQLAEDFARDFAREGTADSAKLLEELRRSLRAELSLERLPARSTWLRITHEGQWAEQEAFVRARVREASPTMTLDADPHDREILSGSPAETVRLSYETIEADLRARLARLSGVTTPDTARGLVEAATTHGVVSRQTAEAIEGLRVMRNLALSGRKDVGDEEARDFLALVDATRYGLGRDGRAEGRDEA